MNEAIHFLKAISKGEPNADLIYADWLEEQGKPEADEIREPTFVFFLISGLFPILFLILFLGVGLSLNLGLNLGRVFNFCLCLVKLDTHLKNKGANT